MEIMLIIIIVIFIGIFGSLGLYFILRYLKGTLDIRVENNNLKFGDTLNGTLKLKVKKAIQSNRLFVALVEEEYRSNGKSGSWVEISRQETTIEESRNYPINFSNFYQFEFQIPAKEILLNTTTNQFINIISSFLKRKTRWRIIARLDAEGVDLDKYMIISIKEPLNNNLNNQILSN